MVSCHSELTNLDGNEGTNQNSKEDKEQDDSPVAPRILSSAPLKCQEQCDDCWQEHYGAVNVKSLDIFFPALALDCVSVGGLEEKEDHDHGNCTNGQTIEVKVSIALCDEDMTSATTIHWHESCLDRS